MADNFAIFRYGLHGGLKGYMGRAFDHTDKGLYHYSFVKTLTNLSDLGPDGEILNIQMMNFAF